MIRSVQKKVIERLADDVHAYCKINPLLVQIMSCLFFFLANLFRDILFIYKDVSLDWKCPKLQVFWKIFTSIVAGGGDRS